MLSIGRICARGLALPGRDVAGGAEDYYLADAAQVPRTLVWARRSFRGQSSAAAAPKDVFLGLPV